MTPTTLPVPTGRIHALRARLVATRAARVAPPRPPAFVLVVLTVTVLNVVGLVMILSASAVQALEDYGSSWHFFNRQLAWAVAGGVVFAAASRLDYHRWARLGPALLGGAGLLLVLVLVPGIGVEVDGGRRWLGVESLRFQPSELAKLALLVVAADVAARRAHRVHDPQQVLKPVGVAFAAIALLVVLEPDLDSTIVLAIIVFTVFIAGGVPVRQLAPLTALGVTATAIAAWIEPYRRERVLAFLHPFSDPANTGYQIKQSLIALGSGGLDGVGLGEGRAKWLFLPNPHTDFIFAVIGEELGLLGTGLVVGLFAGFALVGFHIARRAPDCFGMLLAAGVTAWIGGQAAINLGAVVGLLPVSGITLPYLSAGGSSLVFTMAAAGILANVARQSRPRARSAT